MRTLRLVVTLLILVLLLGIALPAGAQGAVNVSIDNLLVDEFPRTRAMVTVRDANGVPIAELGADRFEIIEDGRASFPPAEVEAHANPDAIISVVMVIDISGSMEGKPIEEAIRAANALLDQLSPEDRAAIVAFADEVESLDPTVLQEGKELGFTVDKNAVRNVVNFLDTRIGWDTPLYDAIYKGVKMASTEPVGKRAVIVMTDGRDERDNAQGVPVKDTGSLSTPDDPINEANRYNIPIFSVGLVGLGGKIDTKYLQRLAERTGGLYREAPEPEELTPLFQDVVNQLKTQYVLTYDSKLPQDTEFHSLMIRVNLPQGQDFDETKVRLLEPEESAPEQTEPVEIVATAEPTQEVIVVAPGTEETPIASVAPAPEESGDGVEGIIDTIRDIIEEKPLLAIGIGVGVLILVGLLVALVVVLLRGRKEVAEEYTAVEFDEPYTPPPPAWTPQPLDSGEPTAAPPFPQETEMAPAAWEAVGEVAPPFGPAPAEFPPAGGTRMIERGPKHLAMLVSKSRPDERYDLKGTVNIGRSQDNQIVLKDPTISRHHAWVKAEGDAFLVFDVGSANGTFVNDERVEAPRELQSGDSVRFGDAEFVFTKLL